MNAVTFGPESWLTAGMGTSSARPDDAPARYRLSELSSMSGVSSRTIRYYQSQRVLPRPRRAGRDALYGEEHLGRLRLIAELRDRGFSLGAIRHLVSRRSSVALSVNAWLGIDETLGGPWSEDQPRHLDDAQLDEVLGGRSGDHVQELERSGYLRAEGDGTWLVPSPTLLELALRMQDAGIDVRVSAQARDLLRRRMARAAEDVITLFVTRAGAGFAGGGSRDEVAEAIATLRPVAREAAGVILAQEIERALRQLSAGAIRSGGRRRTAPGRP